jgi:hypothetical protein
LRFWLLASLLVWLLLAPCLTYAADIKAGPTFSDATTPPPSLGLPSETQPMEQSDDFDLILNELSKEVAKLTTDLSAMSNELQQRKAESAELLILSTSSSVRVAELERAIVAERTGAETAISSALDRESTAIKERDFWRVGGITLASVGIVALALSFIF